MYSNDMFPPLPRQFSGKWHHNSYRVLSELGRGANGVVYLVSHLGKKLAVKVGVDPMDLLMEVNLLKSVQKLQDPKVGPAVCDVDDFVVDGKAYSFYAMEYVEGERLDEYVSRVGADWVPVLMVQLLSHLDILHSQGFVFGDLKPENAMVMNTTKRICLIDFGGVSKIGNAVRQFTEEYDRAFWQAGDRRADTGYDLFSLAVMMMRLTLDKAEWKRISQATRHVQMLYDIIRDNENLYGYRVPLVRALQGKYTSASQMKADLLQAFREGNAVSKRKAAKASSTASKWIGGFFVASLLLLAGSMYLVWM
ncbi:serine/threonine protein kinase [Brevibacillus dissolubilis]|uniref:serine/threonine protein kinase n=1 Tax=Brevibacillus dissolubilis TaxID=1844116 RepID=UPI00111606DA|nr:serine/threonine protein kinase [Brevibacillus dissolubilis]